MPRQLFSRQPIFDDQKNTIGYEILFYDFVTAGNDEENSEAQQEVSTTKTLGSKLAFVLEQNLEKFKALFPDQPNEKIILELQKGDSSLDDLIESINHHQENGFKVAFSELDFNDTEIPLLTKLDIIILDWLRFDEQQLEQALTICEAFKNKLLVQKVETHFVFAKCQQHGLQYFQGNFLTVPSEQTDEEANNSGMLTIKLLGVLQNPDATPDEIEKALAQDARLAYKLLLVVNSPAYGLTRKITSLREAVVYIGYQQIKRWTSLIAMSNTDGKPPELMVTAMVRSKMCELLAEKLDIEDWQNYFTVGLFSTLDALLDKPMAELLEQLCLADHLQEALLSHGGSMGQILNKVKSYERAEWEGFDCSDPIYPLLMQSYLESIEWAESFSSSLRS